MDGSGGGGGSEPDVAFLLTLAAVAFVLTVAVCVLCSRWLAEPDRSPGQRHAVLEPARGIQPPAPAAATAPAVVAATAVAPAPAPRAVARQRAEPGLVEQAMKQPHYSEWVLQYDAVKKSCLFGQAVEWAEVHPAAVNNRKGGASGWTLLHQAAYWRLSRPLLQVPSLPAATTPLSPNPLWQLILAAAAGCRGWRRWAPTPRWPTGRARLRWSCGARRRNRSRRGRPGGRSSARYFTSTLRGQTLRRRPRGRLGKRLGATAGEG